MIFFPKSEPSGEWLDTSSCGADRGYPDLDGDGEKCVESGDILSTYLPSAGEELASGLGWYSGFQ